MVFIILNHSHMKLSVTKHNAVQLEEVYTPVVLKSSSGEEMAICMRDSGFEFCYQGAWYFAKGGVVSPFNESSRGNLLVKQTPYDGKDALTAPAETWGVVPNRLYPPITTPENSQLTKLNKLP